MELHGGSPARVLNILALPKREPTYDTDTGSHRHNAGYTQPLTYCFLPTTRAASGGSLSLPSHPILRPTTTTYYILSTTHTRTHSQGHAHSLGSDAARQRCLLSRQQCRLHPAAMPPSVSPSLSPQQHTSHTEHHSAHSRHITTGSRQSQGPRGAGLSVWLGDSLADRLTPLPSS